MSTPPPSTTSTAGAPAIIVYAQRERARSLVKSAFPRRRTRIVLTRTYEDFDAAFRTHLVDAAVVDVGGAQEETWRVASRAREYPSVPFFGVAPLRAAEGPTLAQCASYEFADVLVDGVDDGAARDIVGQLSYSARFARALNDPPRVLKLESQLQRTAWRFIVSHAGRPVRTSALAEELRVTREHLSRSFAAAGGPNLKRIIDLVRIVAAAELAKNPDTTCGRGEHSRLRVAVASVEYGDARGRHETNVIGSAPDGRSRRAIREGSRAESW